VTTQLSTSRPAASTGRNGLLAQLYQRFRGLVHELGKFGVVGGICFGVDFGLNAVLLSGGVEDLTAKAISTAIAATLAFIGNRFWTWRHRERSGLAREYSLYFFFNLVGLGIALTCVAISKYGLGNVWPAIFDTKIASLIAGGIVGNVFGTIFRFWSYRRFVFLAPAVEPGATQ
jgi:putative flippase GtrA